jgi:hypothetical protein
LGATNDQSGTLFPAWIPWPIVNGIAWYRDKINGISLFSPNLSSGSLGFVNHSYHTNSLYQMMGNFFIGMAPLIGGGLLLSFLCDRWLNFEPGMIVTVVEDGKARWFGAHIGFDPWQLKNNLNDVIKGALMTVKADPLLGGVMLYLMLSISIHIAPSRSDFHNAGRGAFSICLLFCFVSVLMSYLGDNGNVLSIQHLSQEWKHMQIAGSNWVLAYGSIAACFMLLSLLMIMCWALIVLLVRFVIGRRILSA